MRLKRFSALVITVFVLTWILALPAKAQFSLKLTGGGAYVAKGDIDSALREHRRFIVDGGGGTWSGDYETGRFALNWGIEISYALTKTLSLGLEVDSVRLPSSYDASFSTGPPFSTPFHAVEKFRAATIPVALNLRQSFPLGSAAKLFFTVGAGYFLTKVDFEAEHDQIDEIYGNLTYNNLFSANRGSFGGLAGFGIDFRLTDRLGLVLEVQGRMAKVKDIKGTGAQVFWYHETGIRGGTTTPDAYFLIYDFAYQAQTYHLFDFGEAEWYATQPAFTNLRHGTIDLSGVVIQAGLIYRFGSK